MKHLFLHFLKKACFVLVAGSFATSLASCGNDGGGGTNGKIDFSDKKNIFVTIDGKKYNLYDRITVQNFISAGYAVEPSLDANSEYAITDLEGTMSQSVHMYKDGKVYFDVMAYEWWKKGVLKDRVAEGYVIHFANGANTSVMGKFDCKTTKEDVKKILGEPTTQNNSMLLYDLKVNGLVLHFFFWSGSEKPATSVHITCDLDKN